MGDDADLPGSWRIVLSDRHPLGKDRLMRWPHLSQWARQLAGGVNAVRKRSSATVLSPEANASMPTTPV